MATLASGFGTSEIKFILSLIMIKIARRKKPDTINHIGLRELIS